jgi:hypothetical protein
MSFKVDGRKARGGGEQLYFQDTESCLNGRQACFVTLFAGASEME